MNQNILNPVELLREAARNNVQKVDELMEITKRAYVAFGGQLCEACEGLIVEEDEIISLDEGVIHDTKACREAHKQMVKDFQEPIEEMNHA